MYYSAKGTRDTKYALATKGSIRSFGPYPPRNATKNQWVRHWSLTVPSPCERRGKGIYTTHLRGVRGDNDGDH